MIKLKLLQILGEPTDHQCCSAVAAIDKYMKSILKKNILQHEHTHHKRRRKKLKKILSS